MCRNVTHAEHLLYTNSGTNVLKLILSIKYMDTYALPITPQVSFAMAPFSLRREKNPGLLDEP